ncbi:MAG: adenylate/guanylate cyclase domain-containing protein [Actinomycetota bacterium]
MPEIKYTKLGDSFIAYAVIGEGPIDCLAIQGIASHVDVGFEYTPVSNFYNRMASFSRVINFDRRGVGASDPVPLDALPTWEDWTEDVTAVLDAVGSERTAIIAGTDEGPMAMLFAATYPERVSALVLINTTARLVAAADYSVGLPQEQAEALINLVAEGWGTEELGALSNPSLAEDPEYLRWVAKFMRAAATPRVAESQLRYFAGLDARAVLPLIRVPTLIMHTNNFMFVPIDQGRFIAEQIAGARFVELPGADWAPFMEAASAKIVLDYIEEFLTGVRRAPEPDRVLATVMFTDIVGSTQRAAELGDQRWKELLDRLDRVTRGEVEKFGGRLIKMTGDGHLATFDGPGKAIRCARSLVELAQAMGIQIRAGLHTGECELRGTDVGGIAVHIGARVASLAGASEVLVSRTVTDLVAGSGIEFDDRGAHELKGVPGEWRLFAVRA